MGPWNSDGALFAESDAERSSPLFGKLALVVAVSLPIADGAMKGEDGEGIDHAEACFVAKVYDPFCAIANADCPPEKARNAEACFAYEISSNN